MASPEPLVEAMRRREFIALLGGATVACSLAARAQQSERLHRIGALFASPEDNPRVAAFEEGLRNLGWTEGHNIHVDTRIPTDKDQYQPLAKELVAERPEVIFAQSTPVTAALQRETRTIPIVFVAVSDPIGSGFVANLARPSGNITGLLYYEASIAGEWLAILKEIAPRLTRAALMANPKTTPYDYFLRGAAAAAPSLTIQLLPSPVDNATDIQNVIESVAREPNSGLVLPPDATTIVNRDLIIALAARYRLPAVYALRDFVVAGGLMAYSSDIIEQNRQAASYVDQILRGANPAELPVQAPTKFQTFVNLKTARALGLDVPPLMLVRADEVIE
jgi:putative tryptophan/tyrosine transport system substrate-binding protein